MHPDTIARYFTRSDGTFLFKRWAIPMVPGVFGSAAPDHKLLEATFAKTEDLTGHSIKNHADGSAMNASLWFVDNFGDLLKIPGTGGLLGALGGIVKSLRKSSPIFRRSITDDAATGGIGQMAFITQMSRFAPDRPLDERVLRLVLQTQLCWAIGGRFPGLMTDGPNGTQVLSPEALAILRVAYDPSLPHVSTDPALAVQIADLIAARGA